MQHVGKPMPVQSATDVHFLSAKVYLFQRFTSTLRINVDPIVSHYRYSMFYFSPFHQPFGHPLATPKQLQLSVSTAPPMRVEIERAALRSHIPTHRTCVCRTTQTCYRWVERRVQQRGSDRWRGGAGSGMLQVALREGSKDNGVQITGRNVRRFSGAGQ